MKITKLSFIKRFLIGISLLFFQSILYYIASSIPLTKAVNFLTNLDQKIPFIPEFVYIYFSLYLLFFIYFAFFLQYFSKREIWTRLVPSFIALIIISCLFFIFLPSSYPRPKLNPQEMNWISYKLIKFLYRIDPPSNTTPSLHSSSSFLFALISYKISKRTGIIITIWAILIILSTLFVKQHFIADVIIGIALATSIYFIIYQRLHWVLRWRRKYEQKTKIKLQKP